MTNGERVKLLLTVSALSDARDTPQQDGSPNRSATRKVQESALEPSSDKARSSTYGAVSA